MKTRKLITDRKPTEAILYFIETARKTGKQYTIKDLEKIFKTNYRQAYRTFKFFRDLEKVNFDYMKITTNNTDRDKWLRIDT